MKTKTIDPNGNTRNRDNKSRKIKRAKNQSHGQHADLRRVISAQVKTRDLSVDFWKFKHNLACRLEVKYNYQFQIGKINHIIEQEARRYGKR